MGVVIVIVVCVSLYLFFFKSQKKQESSHSSQPRYVPTHLDAEHFSNVTKMPNTAVGLYDGISQIPPEIINLLWFSNGKYKNYTYTSKQPNTFFDLGNGIRVTVNFSVYLDREPSAISETLPIAPANHESVEKMGYYPSYEKMNPQQRFTYLSWLRNIDDPIDIGYVFVFYYGLERYLFMQKSEQALDMIIRLRMHHKNKSFLGYSQGALLASIIRENRLDWLVKFSETMKGEEIEVTALYLYTKHVFSQPLFSFELVNLARKVDFTNTNYIKKERALFIDTLDKILVSKFKEPIYDIMQYNLSDCPSCQEIMFANDSIEPKLIEVPSLLKNLKFIGCVRNLLLETHDTVKEILRVQRIEEKKQREGK